MHKQDGVVLEGDPGVGKTTIFQRFETGAFLADDWGLEKEEKRCEKEWAIGNRQVSVSAPKFAFMYVYM